MSTVRKVETTGPAREVRSYLSAPYIRMLIPDPEEGGYIAEILELPGCVTDGDTPEEAYRNLEEVMAGWIRASLDHGKPIPEPVGIKEYSGHFPLRMSTELHRVAALRAMQEGISLNQWITKAITTQVARENLVEDLAHQIAAEVLGRISLDFAAAFRLQWTGVGSGASLPSNVTRTVITPDVIRASLDNPETLVRLLRPSSGNPVMDAVEDAKEVSHHG